MCPRYIQLALNWTKTYKNPNDNEVDLCYNSDNVCVGENCRRTRSIIIQLILLAQIQHT